MVNTLVVILHWSSAKLKCYLRAANSSLCSSIISEQLNTIKMENTSSLLQLSREKGLSINDRKFIQFLDEINPIKWLWSEFHVSKTSEVSENCTDYKGIAIYSVSVAMTVCIMSYIRVCMHTHYTHKKTFQL